MTEQATPTDNGFDPNTHVTINAVVNYIFGGLTLATMLFAGLFMMAGGAAFGAWMENYESGMGEFFAAGGALIGMAAIMIGLVAGLPQIFAGVGLQKRQEYGRILGLIVAAFHLLYGLTLLSGNVMAVLNLAFGGYAFWSLLQQDVVALFRPEA